VTGDCILLSLVYHREVIGETRVLQEVEKQRGTGCGKHLTFVIQQGDFPSVLFCAVLYCAVLCYVVRGYTFMLFCVTLCYAMLYHGMPRLCCSPATLMLRCLVLCYAVLCYDALILWGVLWCLMLARLCRLLALCCAMLCVLCCGRAIIYVVVAWALRRYWVSALRCVRLLSCVLVCDFLMGLGAVVSAPVLRCARACSVPPGAAAACEPCVLLCWTPRTVRMGPAFPLFIRGVARGGLVCALLCPAPLPCGWCSVCVKA
jgi:hypothetical protein